ncbi:MAG: methyltransferase [Planctomycetota bacterium]
MKRSERLSSVASLALVAFVGACSSTPPVPPAPPEESVKPGINDSFLAEDMAVDDYVARFEVESREVYLERHALAATLNLRRGEAVADIGAGTGLFLEPFAEAVGPAGKVYAVDIAPKFIEHLGERAAEAGYAHVQPHLCSEDSVDLPRASVDIAFICDTYHHFEYPRSTMTSLRDALRPGGEVVLVDFERIPGVTREWLMNHVRAGKDVVTAEVLSFGFELIEEVEVDGLVENYVLRFRKR